MNQVGQDERKHIGTAYHEAGHAVVGVCLGLHLRRIDALPMEPVLQETLDETCHFVEPYAGWSDQDFVTVSRAGFLAEVHLCGKKGWGSAQAYTGDSRDSGSMERRLGGWAGWNGDTHALAIAMQARAKALVHANWQAIVALAETILATGVIDGPRAHQVIRLALEGNAR